MARTVTYRRRTKTGKISTVTRRVSSDLPGPTRGEIKKGVRRAERAGKRIVRRAGSAGSKLKKSVGQIGDTKTTVRSKTTSVKITGPKGFRSSSKRKRK
jgi:hypothetical protein